MQREATLAPSGRATTADVVTLLKRVPAALQNWTWEDQARTRRRGAKAVKWHIDNEYHVQNLLWVVLSPVFPDLEDEEWFRSKGHKHPRCDLRIPSLRLIIEVKFLRAGTQRALADVIEQVSADVGLGVCVIFCSFAVSGCGAGAAAAE
jgi:hypothetical protein